MLIWITQRIFLFAKYNAIVAHSINAAPINLIDLRLFLKGFSINLKEQYDKMKRIINQIEIGRKLNFFEN